MQCACRNEVRIRPAGHVIVLHHMGNPKTRHVLYRRIALILLVGAALAVLGKAGWRLFVEHNGGAFVYAPEDARWVLSDDARSLINEAFAGLEGRAVVDHRVMVISRGRLGDGAMDNASFYRRDSNARAGPLAWMRSRLRLSAAGVADHKAVDAVYISRLLRQIRAMPGAYRVNLLARGWRYDDAGRRDVAGTYTYIANDYVWWLSQQAPEVIRPVVSIHPYRANALELLSQWAARGVNAVTWRPVNQNIDLDDPRTQAFYAALAAHDMTLYLPAGGVDTAFDRKRTRVAPMALQAALKAGVDVVVCIQAGDGQRVLEPLLGLLRGSYGQQLQVVLSGVLSEDALDDVLAPLMQHPQLYSHLRYASGYPRSAMNRRIDLDALAARGFIEADEVEPLREIYRVNPLLFVFVTLRTVRLPHTQLRLPASVFVSHEQAGHSAG